MIQRNYGNIDTSKGEQKEWRIRKADKEKAISINAGDGMTLWDLYQELTRNTTLPTGWKVDQ